MKVIVIPADLSYDPKVHFKPMTFYFLIIHSMTFASLFNCSADHLTNADLPIKTKMRNKPLGNDMCPSEQRHITERRSLLMLKPGTAKIAGSKR